jgi:hypothetical protein
MKTILIDKNTNQATIFTVKADICKKLNICAATLWHWSKHPTKETNDFILYFDVTEYKNKTKVRKHGF